jgi:hypothetical protein
MYTAMSCAYKMAYEDTHTHRLSMMLKTSVAPPQVLNARLNAHPQPKLGMSTVYGATCLKELASVRCITYMHSSNRTGAHDHKHNVSMTRQLYALDIFSIR